jgi:anthranilate phosphoribosyltransferase
MDRQRQPAANRRPMLGALRLRGETHRRKLRFCRCHARATPFRAVPRVLNCVDPCGTGAMRPKHALRRLIFRRLRPSSQQVPGAVVAKHGNRAQSSKCGSADVLEALGVNLNLSAERIARCIDEVGIGFMFAQAHHPAMKHVASIRRELGIRTIFNLLGPLTNPAGANSQVMGVSDMRWVRPIAEVLQALGTRHAIVAHSEDGTDEFSTCAPTHYIEVKDGTLSEGVLAPSELGLACTDPNLLQGGDAQQNATIINQLLHDGDGATADIACLNAAAVLLAANMATDFEDGLKLARASANSGAAREKLALLIEYSNQA